MIGRDIEGEGIAGPDRTVDLPDQGHSAGVTEQLGRLARLHEAGALSADEYTAARRRVIGSD